MEQTHVARMRTELEELTTKLTAIDKFIHDNSPEAKFPPLKTIEKRLIIDQYHAMYDYHKALSGRVALTRAD